jgi:hypothetical protein
MIAPVRVASRLVSFTRWAPITARSGVPWRLIVPRLGDGRPRITQAWTVPGACGVDRAATRRHNPEACETPPHPATALATAKNQ